MSELTLTHEVSPQPPRVGPSTITLRVSDASGKPATGIRIKLEGNMSHAGMSPVFAVAKETEPGRYSSTMELSMAGDWQFVVHMVLPDGRELDRQFEIKGVLQPYSRKGAETQSATAFLPDFFAAWRLCAR